MNNRPMLPGHGWLNSILMSLLVVILASPAWAAARVAPGDPNQEVTVGKALSERGPGIPHIAGPTDIKNLDTGLEYATIQDAIDDVLTLDGHTLEVQVASHAEGIVAVTKQLTIQGMAGGATILANTNTSNSGDARGWFLVTAANLTVKDLTFDGNGFLIWQAFRITTGGDNPSFDNCSFNDIRYQTAGSPYAGTAIAQFGSDGLSVTNSNFSLIGRQGIFFFGASVTSGVASGNTYTGKGNGDWLDYAVEVGAGAVATVTNNTFTDCTGEALSDGSTSAGILATTYFGGGTTANISNNFVTGNTTGIADGYDGTDTSVVTVFDNDLSGNTSGGMFSTSTTVTADASANWWGSNDPTTVAAAVSGDIDYTPWLDNGTDTDGGTNGFQGDFATLDVDDDSPQVGAQDRISEAIGLVTASTVNVAPGTYPGNILLSSSVTLNGAQAGVDARGRVVGVPNPAVESVMTAGSGTILKLLGGSAGSVIDGFTFDGVATAAKGIESSSGPITGVQILNNYFVNMTSTPMFLNDSGEDIDIVQNEFNGSTTTVVHLDTDNFDGLYFVDNNVLSGGGTGLFVDGNRNIGQSTSLRLPLISGNLFDGNETGANLGKRAFEAGSIVNNTFSNSGYDGLQGGMKDALIDGNTFDTNGRYGLALTSFGDSDPAKGAQGCTISGNTFSGNVSAGLLYSSTQAPGTISTNVANGNDFVGNTVGASYAGAEVIDISCNWWGDINGPDAVTNPNPPGDDLSGATMVFWPWLDGSIAGSPNCNQFGSNNVAALPDGDCLSVDNTCESVPVYFNRTDTSPARGASVTFQLSSNLALCDSVVPGNSLPQGTWLGGLNTYLVIDNGNGSYTVDQSTLGSPCGVTTGGLLFNIQVQKRLGATDGTGTITITDVLVRDCVNVTLAGTPGPPADITIDTGAPTAIADLAAAQVKTGNDADGTTKITLTWSPVEAGATVSVYRKGYGDYPEYDDGTGAVPTTPTDPTNAVSNGWALATGVTTSGDTDEVTVRDFYYFVAFVTDECGNVSAVSNQTGGTLNYHLGDVTNGITPGVGDNLVGTADISALGASYGQALIFNDPVNYLDVGPTTDFFVNARPTTDNVLQFEDLMMFAINYGQVSKQVDSPQPAAVDELVLESPTTVQPGATISVPLRMSGAGIVQGLSLQLRWNPQVVEPVGVDLGEFLASQDGVVFSGRPGVVDVALLGLRDRGLAGEGVLAEVSFRILGEGNPQIEIASIEARDQKNEHVELGIRMQPRDDLQATPRVTALLPNVPNPFNPTTRLSFTLARAGDVELSIYDVSGRRVQTLVQGYHEPGRYEQVWDGKDTSGTRVSSGIYYMRLTTPDGRFSRPMTLLK